MVNNVIFSFLKTAHEITTCYNDAVSKERLAPRDWVVVFLYRLGGRANQKDIEREFDLSRPATSQLGDTLIQAGLVTRMIDPEDKRKRLLILTEKGEVRARELCNEFESVDNLLTENLSENDIRELTIALKKLNIGMEKWYRNAKMQAKLEKTR